MIDDTVERDGGVPSGFNLTHEEARQLCTEFLNSNEQLPDSQFGCYIIRGDDSYSNLGRFVEGTVFLGVFNNTPKVMEQEYGPYDNASTFFVVIDHEARMPVGVMRVIENSPAGLKTLNDLEKSPLQLAASETCQKLGIDADKCADIATLAVMPEYRGRAANFLPSLLLYRTLYLTTLDNRRFDYTVTIVDRKAERNLETLKLPFKPIDTRYFSYLDSLQSRALYGVNAEFYPIVEQNRKAILQDTEGDNSGMGLWLTAALDGLANGVGLDEMLAFDKQTKL